MPEHLSRERISVLLDDAEAVAGGLDHLAECAECAREYEQMSRMRMALSALPDLDPPDGAWERVQRELGFDPVQAGIFAPLWRKAASWPLQAAAVVALFAAGLMVGQRLDSGTSAPGETAVAEFPSGALAEPAEAYLRTAADLEALRDHTPSDGGEMGGPEAAMERLTHLDAMIDASREALREAPADPVLNNILFELVDERESLAGELDRTLRMTAAEY